MSVRAWRCPSRERTSLSWANRQKSLDTLWVYPIEFVKPYSLSTPFKRWALIMVCARVMCVKPAAGLHKIVCLSE
jgi:hypothetical protein